MTTNTTMRALVQHQFGNPAEVLAVEEHPLPQPGPGQVRVRTLLAAVHNHDLLTVRGLYGFKPEMPARRGCHTPRGRPARRQRRNVRRLGRVLRR